MFCPSCGKQVGENDNFCPYCSRQLHATNAQPSNSAPSPPASSPQSPKAASSKRPKIGLIITILGTLTIFVAAIIYLAIGNAVVGIVGILFAIVIAVFLRRGQNATEIRAKQLAGLVPFFIGWIIMILIGTVLAFDPVVLVGGLLLVMGGVAIAAGK
jgi:uncharacterized membrane protein YvbJ